VLSTDAYWKGAADTPWLAVHLARVKPFLVAHRAHRLSFGDFHRLHSPPEEWLDWRCDDPDSDLSPRVFVEVLELTTWGEVTRYVESREQRPYWWDLADMRTAARRKFEELTQRVKPGHDA
jgi:hypothetical protein